MPDHLSEKKKINSNDKKFVPCCVSSEDRKFRAPDLKWISLFPAPISVKEMIGSILGIVPGSYSFSSCEQPLARSSGDLKNQDPSL